ncbi:MAG: alpha/beta hydrolase family esterase [Bacillota bacterium]
MNNNFKKNIIALFISILMVFGMVTASFALDIKYFSENDFEMLKEAFDPSDPTNIYYEGMFEQTVTVNEKERTLKIYLPKDITFCDFSVFVAVPSGVDTVDFLEESGWIDIAEKNNLYLVAFEPDNKVWDAAAVKDELAYMTAVSKKTSERTFYDLYTSNYYFVGYGEGGELLQKYIMANPTLCSGLAIFDGSEIESSYLKTMTETMAADKKTPVSGVKVPVLLVNKKTSIQTNEVLKYWLNANDCEDTTYSTDLATVYLQSMMKNTSNVETQPVSSVQTINKKISYTDASFNNKVWDEFLSKAGKYSGNGLTSLRAMYTPEEIGAVKKEISIDGNYRYWYEYVPTCARDGKSSVQLPVVLVLHGQLQKGGIYVNYTEWFKVAEENGFIVEFLSAFPYNGTSAAPVGLSDEIKGIPKPNWNLSDNPDMVNDVAYIKKVIEEAKINHNVNAGKVYITGHSLGSFMTNYMSACYPELFAAAASTSGIMPGSTVVDGIASAPANENTEYEIPTWLMTGQYDIPPFIPQGKAAVQYFINRTKGIINKDNPYTYSVDQYDTEVYVNEEGVPMAQYSFVEGKGHLTVPTEPRLMWGFLSKFTRAEDGSILYMQDEIKQ